MIYDEAAPLIAMLRRFKIGESTILSGDVELADDSVMQRWFRAGKSRARMVVDAQIDDYIREQVKNGTHEAATADTSALPHTD